MRIQFLPDGSLFVLIITNKVVINKYINKIMREEHRVSPRC